MYDNLGCVKMSLKELFAAAWETKFQGEPLPTNLLFLEDESENMSSLAAAFDSAERTIAKLNKERAKQQFILDFVAQRMDIALTARVHRNSATSIDEPSNRDIKSSVCGSCEDLSTKSPSRQSPRMSYGQPLRAQVAAVMSGAKNKLGFSWSHSARRTAGNSADDSKLKSGKKSTAVSRFYDTFEAASMVRACSAPSLTDDSAEYKGSKQPKTSKKISSYGIVPPISYSNLESLGSSTRSSVIGLSRESDSRPGQAAVCKVEAPIAKTYLETDIDSWNAGSPPPRPPPLVERHGKHTDGARRSAVRSHQNIYEEPIEFRKGAPMAIAKEDSEEEGNDSSDEEPVYFNLLLLKQQKLREVRELYSNDGRQSADNVSEDGSDQCGENPFIVSLRKHTQPQGEQTCFFPFLCHRA
jgi:hypothetical protein